MLQSSTTSKNRTIVRSPISVRLVRAALQTAFAFSDGAGASLAERLFTSPRRHPRPSREQLALATGHRFTIDVNLRSPRWNGARTKVVAWRWGIGPTALLIHGWEGRGSQLGAFVEPLVRAGLSVVTFDAPAHGDSPGSRLYLTDHADAVIDVAKTIGPLHAIVAHSFGAPAVMLAHSRGDIDAPRNVFISPNAIVPESIDHFCKSVGLDDDERALFEERLVDAAGISANSWSLQQLLGVRDSSLLVIHDIDDREVSFAHGDRLAQLWPNATLEATQGLGHRRILRDPTVIARVAAAITHGVSPPVSDLVREVDRQLAAADMFGV
ncbi:MAG: alpha/beta hydrolase [Kofleriaceae bacterium]